MKRKIPDDMRDRSKWDSIADEGDYYCYLAPVSEMDILRQSGLNKICVHKQWFQQAPPTAEDFENWMNQEEPIALEPTPTWYIGPA